MRWTEAHGLVVRRHGEGPEVVWIHGLGESSRCFEAISRHPALAGLTHVLVDLPGYGRARWLDRPDSIAGTVERLVRFLGEAPAPPWLVGHSLGGVLGALVAEAAPLSLAGLVDVDGNVSRGDCTYSAPIAAVPGEDFVASWPGLAWESLHAGATTTALRGYMASLAFADPAQLWRHAVDLVALSSAEDLGRRRAALGIPLRFVAGVPGGICARSMELLGQAGVPVSVIEPSGHWPFIDRPDEFAGILREVIGSKAR